MDDILRKYDKPAFYGTEQKVGIPASRTLFFDVQQSHTFKGFLDIGADNVAMIMEDQTDFDLTFVRISDVSS